MNGKVFSGQVLLQAAILRSYNRSSNKWFDKGASAPLNLDSKGRLVPIRSGIPIGGERADSGPFLSQVAFAKSAKGGRADFGLTDWRPPLLLAGVVLVMAPRTDRERWCYGFAS